MTNAYYSKLFALINIIYRKIFHTEVSIEVEKFIKNLSYVGIGSIIASVFSLSYNILAGRWLGPSEYGTFTLVQSVAMFLYIPMLLGFHTAMVKYNAEKIDFSRQRCIISTTYILVLLFMITSLLVYFTFSEEIMALFSIPGEIFYFAVLFAVIFVIYTLGTETLRSLHMIREYSRLKSLHSGILFLSFLMFVFVFQEISFRSPLFSMLLAYGIIEGIVLVFLRKYIIPEFSGEWARTLHKFSIFSLMGGISSILYINVDKIFINLYLSVSDVGVYWAYNYSFTTMTLLCTSIFVTVFFPVASMCSDKEMLFNRINKIAILIIILGWPVIAGIGYVILKLYGGSYPFDLSLALLFATAAIFISVDQLYGQLLNSEGLDGVKITSSAAVVLAVVNVLLNILLIPLFGLNGAVIATIIGYLASISIMLLNKKRLRYSR